jgi:hypothetical protein
MPLDAGEDGRDEDDVQGVMNEPSEDHFPSDVGLLCPRWLA